MPKLSNSLLFNGNKTVVIADNGIIPTYNGSNLTNVKPVTQRIDFTSSNSSVAVWNNDNTSVTIVHSMNCIICQENTTRKGYADGILTTTETINKPYKQVTSNQINYNASSCWIMYGIENANNKCYMSSIRIYNRLLSQKEILKLSNEFHPSLI